MYNRPMADCRVQYKSSNTVVYSCKYHVVWCPKYRRDVLKDGADVRLKEIIREVCNESSSDLIELEVMPDHVHLLVEVDPQYGITKAPRVALIDEDRCIGCALCLPACPVDAIVGAPRLMHTVIAAQCTGCDLCLAPCPVDCISMVAPADGQPGRAAA